MKNYEVEIKSLLGSKEAADSLKTSLKKQFKDLKLTGQGKQLNHYFNTPTNLKAFEQGVIDLIPADKKEAFDHVISHGTKISIRTRDADGAVFFIIKASVGDDTSSNGVKRVEFEIPAKMSLNELDEKLIKAGASYQAKWSREREEYSSGDMNVCLDKNAGYGYLAEFEKVIQDDKKLDQTRADLLATMKNLGINELSQDRLERMFAHYNKHWNEYYGSDKTFTVL